MKSKHNKSFWFWQGAELSRRRKVAMHLRVFTLQESNQHRLRTSCNCSAWKWHSQRRAITTGYRVCSQICFCEFFFSNAVITLHQAVLPLSMFECITLQRIFPVVMIINNRLFAECEVLDNFPGLFGHRIRIRTICPRTRTCKLVLVTPHGSSSTRTFLKDNNTGFSKKIRYINNVITTILVNKIVAIVTNMSLLCAFVVFAVITASHYYNCYWDWFCHLTDLLMLWHCRTVLHTEEGRLSCRLSQRLHLLGWCCTMVWWQRYQAKFQRSFVIFLVFPNFTIVLRFMTLVVLIE